MTVVFVVAESQVRRPAEASVVVALAFGPMPDARFT
jgi:hypothetical protein